MSSSVIQFDIDQWQAWAPGLASADDWAIWARHPRSLDNSEAQPDVAFLPAMQRRRLSRLARMAFAVATPLAAGLPPMPLVFASRHGDTSRTFAILNDLAREYCARDRNLFRTVIDEKPDHNVGIKRLWHATCA